jgi:hypothetical protein
MWTFISVGAGVVVIVLWLISLGMNSSSDL